MCDRRVHTYLMHVQAEPNIAGPTIVIDIAGVNVCCHKSMDQLVDAVSAAVVQATEAYVRDNQGAPLPAVRLHMRAPQLLFALMPERCALKQQACTTLSAGQPRLATHAPSSMVYTAVASRMGRGAMLTAPASDQPF